MPKKAKVKATSTRVLDYPENMSQYEKESLAAEAILKAKREGAKKTSKARKTWHA